MSTSNGKMAETNEMPTVDEALASADRARGFDDSVLRDSSRALIVLADEVLRHRALRDRSGEAYRDANLGKVVDDMIVRLNLGDIDGACDVFNAVIVNGFGDKMFESARPSELKKFWKDLRGIVVAMYQAGKADK